MIYYHLFALFLLGVDWLEDPHFGQFQHSRRMASELCIADELQHSESDLADQLQLFEQPPLLPALSNAPLITSVTLHSESPYSVPILYTFMSLQR